MLVSAGGYSAGLIYHMLGIKLPISVLTIQAMVTQPLKPLLDHVVSSGAYHCYANQTLKGEIATGAHMDQWPNYTTQNTAHYIKHQAESLFELVDESRNGFPAGADGVGDVGVGGAAHDHPAFAHALAVVTRQIEEVPSQASGHVFGSFACPSISAKRASPASVSEYRPRFTCTSCPAASSSRPVGAGRARSPKRRSGS